MDKLLIIDDSRIQAASLRAILEPDYDVTLSYTGNDGLQQAMTGAYSLILLDVIMPNMDGFTLLQTLQEAALTKYIPVILITSLSSTRHEERGLTMGAVDYITKPFNPTIVRARVNTHIKLYHYQDHFRQQAMVDELTGVANRRRYENDRLLKWREAICLGLPFSICILDVDHFKAYNDAYGHPAGDRVLADIAQTMSKRLRRTTDFFGRYGGEEFVMMLLGDEATAAYTFVKNIRQEIEDLHIPCSSPVSEWVTISAGGVTCTPHPGFSFDTYLKIADTMLYDAKRLGRNRVVWNHGGEQWMEK